MPSTVYGVLQDAALSLCNSRPADDATADAREDVTDDGTPGVKRAHRTWIGLLVRGLIHL